MILSSIHQLANPVERWFSGGLLTAFFAENLTITMYPDTCWMMIALLTTRRHPGNSRVGSYSVVGVGKKSLLNQKPETAPSFGAVFTFIAKNPIIPLLTGARAVI
jgi:hypothetical protein